MDTGLKMLTAKHCLHRAERFRLKMLTTDEPVSRGRLHDIADNYRRLADDAPQLHVVPARVVENRKEGRSNS